LWKACGQKKRRPLGGGGQVPLHETLPHHMALYRSVRGSAGFRSCNNARPDGESRLMPASPTVRERGIRAKISLSACSSPQYLQRPTSSHVSKNTPILQGVGRADVARSRRRGASVKSAASRAVTTEIPHKRESRRGRTPEEPLVLYEGGNSDALFSGEVQFFLDFVIVGLSPEEGLVTSPEVSSDGVCFKTRRVTISQTCRLAERVASRPPTVWGLAAERHDGIGQGTERWHEGR
jgi:hypothetical protein